MLTAAQLGCEVLEYAPSETNFVEVAPPASGVTLELVAGDTLAGWGDITLTYQLDTQGKAFAFTRVYVDGTLVVETPLPSGIEINSRNLSNRAYRLVVESYAHSGTGSLADRLQAEWVFDRKEATLIVDNALPTPVAVTAVAPQAAGVQVSWAPYTRPNFQEYQIYRENGRYYSDGTIKWEDLGQIAQTSVQTQSSIVDTDYTGGLVRYAVRVKGAGDLSVLGATKMLDRAVPALQSFELVDDQHVRLAWSATRFPTWFSQYQLFRDDGTEAALIAEVTQPEDTVFVDTDVRFGLAYTYWLETEAATPGGSPIQLAYPVRLSVATAPRASDLINLPVHLAAGWYGQDRHPVRIIRYDLASDTVEAASSENFGSVFADRMGQRLFSANGGTLIYERDPETVAPTRSLSLQSLMGFNAMGHPQQVAAGGRMVAWIGEKIGSTTHPRGPVLLDFDSGTLLKRYDDTVNGDQKYLMDLSDDGEYVIFNEDPAVVLYRILETGVAQVATLETGCSYAFLAAGATFAKQCADPTVTVYQTVDQTVLRSFSLDSGLTYDPGTHTFAEMAASDNVFRVYDADDGRLLASVAVNPVGAPYRLIEGVLWSKTGYYRPLNLDNP